MFRQTALQQLPEFFCFRQKGVKRPFYPLSGRHYSLNPGRTAVPLAPPPLLAQRTVKPKNLFPNLSADWYLLPFVSCLSCTEILRWRSE